MSKRALILWVCFGILLLSAARVTTVLHPEASEAPPLNIDTEAPAVSSQEQQFRLLSATYGPTAPAVEEPTLMPAIVEESTLWLARAIYSETKLPHEQELV